MTNLGDNSYRHAKHQHVKLAEEMDIITLLLSRSAAVIAVLAV